MSASLVERPRLALATAVAIVAAVALVAALFPYTISIAEIPERGNGVEDLWGRKFVAVEATEGDQSYQLNDERPLSVTFELSELVTFGTACGEIAAEYRLDEARFDWRKRPPTYWHECSGRRQVETEWVEAFLAERPAWRLDGDTLELSSDFGTMTMVDEGEGTKPSEIRGKRFYTARWEMPAEDEKPRFRANTWLSLSFDRDGTMRAKLGCESVVVPTEVRAGWFRVTEALQPQRTTDCSRSMAAQETAWLWDLLDQPVQWQVRYGQNLSLKAYGSEQELLWVARVFDDRHRRTDPALLAGRTLYGAPHSARTDNLDGYGGIVIEVADNGAFTATAGCERPSIHGQFRTGWIQFGKDLEWSLSACEDSDAEQWLADFLAHEPTWYTGRDGEVVLSGAGHFVSFADADDYWEIYLEPPPSDVGGS